MAVESRWMPCQLKIETNLCSRDYDGIILVSGNAPGSDEPEPFKTVLYAAAQIDAALGVIGAVLPINLLAKRLIYSPTGPLNMDYHDVRSFAEAATKGIKRALQAGVKSPLLVLLPDDRFENVELITLLGALEALYVIPTAKSAVNTAIKQHLPPTAIGRKLRLMDKCAACLTEDIRLRNSIASSIVH